MLGVYFVLGFPLPLGPCLVVIALSAWLNIFLTIRWRKSMRLHETHAGLYVDRGVVFVRSGQEDKALLDFSGPADLAAWLEDHGS